MHGRAVCDLAAARAPAQDPDQELTALQRDMLQWYRSTGLVCGAGIVASAWWQLTGRAPRSDLFVPPRAQNLPDEARPPPSTPLRTWRPPRCLPCPAAASCPPGAPPPPAPGHPHHHLGALQRPAAPLPQVVDEWKRNMRFKEGFRNVAKRSLAITGVV